MKEKNNNGITLIALIITVIVMLILVGVTINVALQGGLFGNARKAVTDTQYEKDKEMLYTSIMGAFNDKAEVDFNKLDESLPDGFTKSEDGGYTSEAGNTFYVDKNGNITDEKVEQSGPQVTVDGKTITLTPENLGEYIGKKVTNYTGKSSVEIEGQTYEVSTDYYLYYVDFGNKYGDGEGTIYLKASSNSHGYNSIPTTETLTEDDLTNEKIKIKNLNPALFAEGVEHPPFENDNMKMVRWLTNTENWDNLKDSSFSGNINYVVGAPSLEMFADSYTKRFEFLGYSKSLDLSVFPPSDRKPETDRRLS